jgi:hypothetical protein
LAINELLLEVFQSVIIELELPFEGAIGDASAALEYGYGVVEDLLSASAPCGSGPVSSGLSSPIDVGSSTATDALPTS